MSRILIEQKRNIIERKLTEQHLQEDRPFVKKLRATNIKYSFLDDKIQFKRLTE